MTFLVIYIKNISAFFLSFVSGAYILFWNGTMHGELLYKLQTIKTNNT